MDRYAVWGNPIAHSLSPKIHTLFAKQTGQKLIYEAKLGDIHHFSQQLADFFQQGGKGCNITAPFKEQAFLFATKRTERCQLAQSCNTLMRLENGEILGDNTDGMGLVADLKRLNWLKPHQKVMILGAGGAVRGVLFPLLQAKQHIFLFNRTFEKAQYLAERFQSYGNIQAIKVCKNLPIDLVINAIPYKNDKNFPISVADIFQPSHFYDMQYCLTQPTPFLQLAKKQHSLRLKSEAFQDGLGMLLGQGAESFALWRGVEVDGFSLLNTVRQK